MAWRNVVVNAWVPEFTPPSGPVDPGFGVPGWPAHPIAPGGGGNVPMPPIYYPPYPDQGLPIGPAHPIAPGGQPPYPAHPIAPGGTPPGIWGGAPLPVPTPPIYWPPSQPGVPTHPIVLPPPVPPESGSPEHPIFYPPVIWPDPPTGYPSIDPDQLPQHPEVPDMTRGIWTWLQQGEQLVRAFAVPSYYVSADLPGYVPTPPASGLPGDWVVGLFNAGPAWCWIPSADSGSGGGEGGGSGERPDHTLPGDLPKPDQGLPETPGAPGAPDQTLPGDLPRPDQGLPENPPQQPGGQPDQTLPGDLPHPDQGLPPDQPVVDPR
jgi:hypothetical protein